MNGLRVSDIIVDDIYCSTPRREEIKTIINKWFESQLIHDKTKQNHAVSKQNKICLDNAKYHEIVLCDTKKTLAKQTKQNRPVFNRKKILKTKTFFYSVLQILLGCLVLVDREVLKPP